MRVAGLFLDRNDFRQAVQMLWPQSGSFLGNFEPSSNGRLQIGQNRSLIF
jgi:hypothetical protein